MAEAEDVDMNVICAQPIFLVSEKAVPFDEVSFRRPESGWRDKDEEVVAGIKDSIFKGTHRLHISRIEDIILVKNATDASGKHIIDDGFQTAAAWADAKALWVEDRQKNPLGLPWADSVVLKFQTGFTVAVADYGDDSGVERRVMWNVGKHDEEKQSARSFHADLPQSRDSEAELRAQKGLESRLEGLPRALRRVEEKHRESVDQGRPGYGPQNFGKTEGDENLERKVLLG